ncbi:hypothetical protein Trydic_g4073 [Trypoxylus dichotomus]
MYDCDTVPDSFYSRYYSSLYDIFNAFMDANIGIMSNMQFISKQCQELPSGSKYDHRNYYRHDAPSITINRPFRSVLESAQPVSGSSNAVDNRGSVVQTSFSGTWLWDLVTVENGKTNLERKLPDSITNWKGNVMCMSSDKGFGTSDKIEIQCFKPFFVDILLPYSNKRNKEILHLPISVFNSLNCSVPVCVILDIENGIVLMDYDDENSFDMWVGAEDSYYYYYTYRIKATKLGNLNIIVSGFLGPFYAKYSALDSIVKRRDVVQKLLLVEPEGYPSSLVKSALLCANGPSGNNIKWDVSLPENVVPDTVDGKVTVNSHILGPMFQKIFW